MPARAPSKICLVSAELNRLFRNGGIGTACTGLAQLLAELGHRVTVLYTGELDPTAEGAFDESADFYQRELGISVQALRPSPQLGPSPARFAARALSVHHQLRDGDWDAIFFNDVCAEGYYAVTAKRAGLAYAHTALCVVAHGPRTWVRELNDWLLADGDELENVFMERETARFADHLISPSRYMLDWLRGDGWTLPASTMVTPVRLPRLGSDVEPAVAVPRGPVRELVFFGRLEYRKGITLFCDAIDRVTRERDDLRVTFLGKFGDVLGEHGGSYVLRRARAWPARLRLLPRLHQHEALDYLRQRADALAVVPSRVDNLPCAVAECLREGIPFVATDTGGIPELVAGPDRTRCLCAPDPDALAAAIRPALEAAPVPARPAQSIEEVDAHWRQTLERVLDRRAAPDSSAPGVPPLVSVIVASAGEQLVPTTRRSIEEQTHASIELTRVPAGSEPDAAAARRAAIEAAGGEYMLLMHDATVLSTHAVERLLGAALRTSAPIVTAFAYAPNAHAATLTALPIGNARAAGYCRNVFGGSTALIHKRALREAGLSEHASVGGTNWAFYAEASFLGLEIVCVPEPMSWAGPLPGPWPPSAHPAVRAVFEHHAYRDCALLLDLLARHVAPVDAHPFHHELAQAEHAAILQQLAAVEPQSDSALALVVAYLTRTGRLDTAGELHALIHPGPDREIREWAIPITRGELGSVALAPSSMALQDEHPFPLVRVHGQPPALQVHPVVGRELSGVLALGPALGLRAIRAQAFLSSPDAPPVEFRLALARVDGPGLVAASAWTRLDGPDERATMELSVPALEPADYELVFSTRLPGARMSYAHARFGAIELVYRREDTHRGV